MASSPRRRAFAPLLIAAATVLATPVLAQTAAPAHVHTDASSEPAPAAAGDPALRAKLEAQSLGYEVDEDGDFRIVVGWRQEGRSQLVFVSGQPNPLGDSTVREVFSPAARVPADGFSAEQANRLLRDSQENVLGAWEIAGDVLFYVIKLHDDADGARFAEAVDTVAQLADDMEIQLSDGGDDL